LRSLSEVVVNMKIAQISPLCESVPPRLYGGTERVVAQLTDALVAQGHDVTLFASADSRTRAHLAPMRRQALRLDPAPLKLELAAHLTMLDEVRRRADEFDVLHFHIDLIHFPFFEHMSERTLTTLHGRLDFADLPESYRRWHRYPLVSISNAQRRPMPFANWLGTVHHGISPNQFRFSATPGNDLVFVGRISPEKRPDRAIEIARRSGRSLKIAAKIDPVDAAYHREKIEPLLAAAHVEFVGEVDDSAKNELLASASALLFPIDWPEPFGLVMIEAMACGTPVIAWNNGSVREIIDHGVTGFVVDSMEAAVAAVRQAERLDRRAIRATFERRFSSRVMAAAYARLYAQLITVPQRSRAKGL
jgi:glycosyltransferase involved in cell wall biosynthesis